MKNAFLTSASCVALFFMATTAATAGSPVTSIASVSPIAASAGGNWYASVFAGAGMLEGDVTGVDIDDPRDGYTVSFDNGFGIGGTVGRRFNEHWRVEVELSFASYEGNEALQLHNGHTHGPYSADGPLSATYLLANVWYDIPNRSKFTPYVGAGLGLAKIGADMSFDDDDYAYGDAEGINFAYQVGAGVTYAISDRMSLDVGYRYKAVDDVTFTANDGDSDVFEGAAVHSHSLQAGVMFNF